VGTGEQPLPGVLGRGKGRIGKTGKMHEIDEAEKRDKTEQDRKKMMSVYLGRLLDGEEDDEEEGPRGRLQETMCVCVCVCVCVCEQRTENRDKRKHNRQQTAESGEQRAHLSMRVAAAEARLVTGGRWAWYTPSVNGTV
jgi:hypothetical protein